MYEAVLLTIQTLVQVVGLAGASYALVRWQRQSQRQSQHPHIHDGSFDDTEVERRKPR